MTESILLLPFVALTAVLLLATACALAWACLRLIRVRPVAGFAAFFAGGWLVVACAAALPLLVGVITLLFMDGNISTIVRRAPWADSWFHLAQALICGVGSLTLLPMAVGLLLARRGLPDPLDTHAPASAPRPGDEDPAPAESAGVTP